MPTSLPQAIVTLIHEEQARQDGRFIRHPDLPAYLAKLGEHAEIVSDTAAGRCRGFVAFYGNNLETRQAFITLVVVDPRDRGTGLGKALVACVLAIARQRGFASCRLEVAKDNQAAYDLYSKQGFHVVHDGTDNYLLEIAL